MSISLFDDAQALLALLAASPDAALPASTASARLGWEAARLNEAGAILRKAGLASTHELRGAEPFRFGVLRLTERGVEMASKLPVD